MNDKEIGQSLVETHLGAMNAESRRKQVPIVEIEGFRIVKDYAYQGFDAGFHPWWTEPRFWCRSITVEHISTGRRGSGIGPQAEAYATAVERASLK